MGKGSSPAARSHQHPAERKCYQMHRRRCCICRPRPSHSVAAARVLASSRTDFDSAASSVACDADRRPFAREPHTNSTLRVHATLLGLTRRVLLSSPLALEELETRSNSREKKIERSAVHFAGRRVGKVDVLSSSERLDGTSPAREGTR